MTDEIENITEEFIKSFNRSVEQRTSAIKRLIENTTGHAPESDFYSMLLLVFDYPQIKQSKDPSGYFSDSTLFEFGLYALPFSITRTRIDDKVLRSELALYLYRKFIDLFDKSDSIITPSKNLISKRDSFYRTSDDDIAYKYDNVFKVLNHTYGCRILPLDVAQVINKKPPSPYWERIRFKKNLFKKIDEISTYAHSVYSNPILHKELK